MKFSVGDTVALIATGKSGVVKEIGLPSLQGIQWLRVKFSQVPRWLLADKIRPHVEFAICVDPPHGIVVSKKSGCPPEVFMTNDSNATGEEAAAFADTVYHMWESRGRP